MRQIAKDIRITINGNRVSFSLTRLDAVSGGSGRSSLSVEQRRQTMIHRNNMVLSAMFRDIVRRPVPELI